VVLNTAKTNSCYDKTVLRPEYFKSRCQNHKHIGKCIVNPHHKEVLSVLHLEKKYCARN
jgi:hypothetical protein